MPRRLPFDRGLKHVERWGADAPTALMKDGEVVMYHVADTAFLDGVWDSSLVRVGNIPDALEKGWVGELPGGKVLRGAEEESVDLGDMTVPELRAFAEVNGVSLVGIRSKAKLLEAIEAANG